MHPDVTRDQPDRCPKCGMKLVPARLVQEAACVFRAIVSADSGGS
jgi:hypothetical protein